MTKAEVLSALREPQQTSTRDGTEYLRYTFRLETEETIRQDANVTVEEKPDLYSELQKLKALKDDGLITEEE